jgi:hypothetical protein
MIATIVGIKPVPKEQRSASGQRIKKDPLHIKERREISTVQITSGRLGFDD